MVVIPLHDKCIGTLVPSTYLYHIYMPLVTSTRLQIIRLQFNNEINTYVPGTRYTWPLHRYTSKSTTAVYGKSVIARDRERQPSTNQITALTRAMPATYQSYLPKRRNHPAYIAHRTRTRTHQNAQHTAAHATMDVRSRHITNPRSTRFVLGKASEYTTTASKISCGSVV